MVENREYNVGTRISVKKVATIKPKITTMAMDCYHWLDSLTREIAAQRKNGRYHNDKGLGYGIELADQI